MENIHKKQLVSGSDFHDLRRLATHPRRSVKIRQQE